MMAGGWWLLMVGGQWPVAGGWFAGGRWLLALGGVLVGGPVAGGSRWPVAARGRVWLVAWHGAGGWWSVASEGGNLGTMSLSRPFKSCVCRKSTKIDFIPFQLDRARGN